MSAGALPPEFKHMGLAALSLLGCLTAFRLHVSHFGIVFTVVPCMVNTWLVGTLCADSTMFN